MKVYLPIAYFPPVQYFSKLLNEEVYIEVHENFQKQTIRNRCELLGANGKIVLSVPVINDNRLRTPICDLKISYQNDWQRIHFQTIKSAYASSPFYPYFIDEFLFVFEEKQNYLYDLNMKIINKVNQILGNKFNIRFTEIFNVSIEDGLDMRNSISSKPRLNKPDSSFAPAPYTQVFSDRFSFTPNLSILDLLFNMGPDAISILKKSFNFQGL